MKIALVSFGHADVSLALYKELRKNFIDVDLILVFSQQRKRESVIDFSKTPVTDGFLSELTSEKIIGEEIRNYLNGLPIRLFIYNNQKLLSLKNLFLSMKFTLHLKKYQIIHFSGEHGTLLHLLALLPLKRKIFTIHDFYPHSSDRYSLFNRLLHSYLIKCFHPVVIQNYNDFMKLKSQYPLKHNKLFYIPLGILDIYNCFKKGVSAEASDLLFFGRISSYKGILYLLKALKHLSRKNLFPKCIIAGEGSFTEEECRLLEDKFLNVTLINKYITNDLLAELLRNTKVVICPYIDATQSAVVMTSYAFNKPVIATRVGNFTEVIVDGISGKLIDPADPVGLASAIEDILVNKCLPDTCEYSKIPGLKNFQWHEIALQTQEVYKKIN